MPRSAFRAMRVTCAVALLTAPALADPPLDTSTADEETPPPPRHFGLMFDVGSIEGGILSFSAQPYQRLRLEAGAGTNGISPGFRLGAVALPFGNWPTISISGGHFFPGDINGLVRVLSTGGYTHDPRLEHFDYDFASLHLGWETECAGVLFFVRAGASILWTQLPAGNPAPNNLGRRNVTASTTASSDPYWLLLPSLRIGFVGFL